MCQLSRQSNLNTTTCWLCDTSDIHPYYKSDMLLGYIMTSTQQCIIFGATNYEIICTICQILNNILKLVYKNINFLDNFRTTLFDAKEPNKYNYIQLIIITY